jgi:hypothetical protein
MPFIPLFQSYNDHLPVYPGATRFALAPGYHISRLRRSANDDPRLWRSANDDFAPLALG